MNLVGALCGSLWLVGTVEASSFSLPGRRNRETQALKLSLVGSCKNLHGSSPQAVRTTLKDIQVHACVFLGSCLCFPECCLLFSDPGENLTYTWSSLGKATGDSALVTRGLGKEDHLPPYRNQSMARSQGCGGSVPPPFRSCQRQMPCHGIEHSCLLGGVRKQGMGGAVCLYLFLSASPQDGSQSRQKLKVSFGLIFSVQGI